MVQHSRNCTNLFVHWEISQTMILMFNFSVSLQIDILCVWDLIADLFDGLHAEVFDGDAFGVFADPPPLGDLIDSERLPSLPTAGQTTALHYRLHLETQTGVRQRNQDSLMLWF